MSSFFPNAPDLIKRYPIFTFSLALLTFGLFEIFEKNFSLANFILLVIIVIGGIPLSIDTIKEVLKRNFGADVIAILAIVTSLFLGEYLAGAIIIIMLSGGRALEDFALQNASDALKKLAENAPRIAHLVKGTEVIEIKVEVIREGDILLVKPGELIPVDGVIIEGETSLNEAALTGEPVPTHKAYSSAVLSGSVNLDNPVKIRTIRKASESKYEQIVALVRAAQTTKAPIHRLADRYGAIFTPITLLVAGLAFLFTHNVTNVLAVLVVATPCPLILATPIAIMGGINKSAKRGIVVKNGGSLEKVGATKAVVFDKTGTLTFGVPKVIAVKLLNKITESDLLFYAASVERLSAHILSKAVVKQAHDKKVKLIFPEKFKENFGKGVIGTVKNKDVVVSNVKFLQSLGINFEPKLLEFKKNQNELGRMVSFVSINKKIAGAIVFGDEIRPDVKQIIQQLKNSGIKLVAMLTGDNEKVADQVAKLTGIDIVKAQSLPDEKVIFVNELKAKYVDVVMVGDGFNDAPALAASSVGIALGASGSSVSSESADIVLLADDLAKVREVIGIGKQVLAIAKNGILFGMGASFVAMIFASVGLIKPVQGALLQEVIDVVVIFNALRASR